MGNLVSPWDHPFSSLNPPIMSDKLASCSCSSSQSTFDLVHTLISICRMLLAPYIFVYGWVLIATFHLQQAYGTRIAGYGIGEWFMQHLIRAGTESSPATLLLYMGEFSLHNS